MAPCSQAGVDRLNTLVASFCSIVDIVMSGASRYEIDAEDSENSTMRHWKDLQAVGDLNRGPR